MLLAGMGGCEAHGHLRKRSLPRLVQCLGYTGCTVAAQSSGSGGGEFCLDSRLIDRMHVRWLACWWAPLLSSTARLVSSVQGRCTARAVGVQGASRSSRMKATIGLCTKSALQQPTERGSDLVAQGYVRPGVSSSSSWSIAGTSDY